MDWPLLMTWLAYGLILLGVVGSVIPILPGPLLVWVGVLAWAWTDAFMRVGWLTIGVLGVLALVAWGSDLYLGVVLSRRSGASWKSIAGAIISGLIGSALLSWIPFIGTLVGAIVGALLGMWFIEYRDKGSSDAAYKSLRAYATSVVLASMLEMSLTFLMVAIFFWQAFL